jgi:AraC-like DNA-binding protein
MRHMPPNTITVLAGVLRPFPRVAERLGLPADRLLREAGIAAEDFSRAGARLPIETSGRLLTRAAELSGRADFGVQLGLAHHPSDLGALGYCWLSAPDVAAALTVGLAFEPVAQGGTAFTVTAIGDEIAVTYQAAGLAPAWQAQDAEFTFALLLTAMRTITQRRLRPSGVAFAHAPPADTAPYAVAFGAKVTFLAGANTITFPATMLDVQIPTHDAQLFTILRDHLTHVAEGLREPLDLLEAVRRAVRINMADGDVSVSALARSLRVSTRTLQRRLAQAGTSLRAEIAAARATRAAELFAHPGTRVAEAARLLGFADAGSLRRALEAASKGSASF